jgi:serine/threonine protein kinase
MSLSDSQTNAVDTLVGKQFDEYLIEARLGSGGMAQVYRALDRKLQRRVALKVIAPKYRVDNDYVRRFEREAQSIARLEHANIVHIYRFGQVGDVYYMAMQYIDGADLDYLIGDYRQTDEFMNPGDILNVVRDIGLALDYAHEHQVIHRDVKPGNIILDKTGRAFLSDFGLALLNDIGTHGEILGSPLYIAPEQVISSANVVPQSDLYSMGVVLFEMLTGELPFTAPDSMDVAVRHVTDRPPDPVEFNPEIPDSVSSIVLRCLAKEPSARYQTGKELIDALTVAVDKWVVGVSSTSKASHLHASHMTNPQKVQLRLEATPLTSSPSTTDTLPPASTTRAKTPTAPKRYTERRSPLLLGIGVFAAGCLGIFTLFFMNNRPTAAPTLTASRPPLWTVAPTILPTLVPTSVDPPTPTALLLPTTNVIPPALPQTTVFPTDLPTITAIVIQPVPVLIQTLIPTFPSTIAIITPTIHTLAIQGNKDWIALVNVSSYPLSLDKLEFRQNNRILRASDWRLTILQPGECLRLFKGPKAPKPPAGCDKNIYDYDGDKKVRDEWFKNSIEVVLSDTETATIRMGGKGD